MADEDAPSKSQQAADAAQQIATILKALPDEWTRDKALCMVETILADENPAQQ